MDSAFRANEVKRFVRIFAKAYCTGVTNRSCAAKLFTLCSIISQISRDVWPFVMCIIMKALNGFPMILKQMTLCLKT